MDGFIRVNRNAFSHEFCNKVIDYFNEAEEGGLVIDRQSHDQVPKLLKQDLAKFIPEQSFPFSHTSKEILTEFNDVFWGKCYAEYANQYDILSSCDAHKSYTIKIQKTRPGEGYHVWHAENTCREHSNRLLTWTVYLNDEFEAGETEFLYQHYRYKPNKGDCVIFPAAFTHTHRGNPPIGGDKYIITGWIEF